jgi:fermentation-respiration switch protein FrsA (DUF1100 family)
MYQDKNLNMFLTTISFILVLYTTICVFLFFFQRYLIYFPAKHIAFTPTDIALQYEDIFISTADNIRIHGWFIPATAPQGVILLCHGNAGNISDRLELLRIFNGLSLDVLIFDYRGFGRSEGSVNEAGTYQDATAAWNYLLEQKESSYTSLPDLGSKLYPFFPVRLLARYHYRTIENLKSVFCPVLFIHSRADEVVPFSLGIENYQAANEPKHFLEINGSHNNGYIISTKIYSEGIKNFLDKYLNN